MAADKINLSEMRPVGNLNTGLIQIARYNYMPKTEKYEDKIELAITLEKQGLQEGAYRSLRFCNPAFFQSFVINTIKAYIFFLKQKGILKPENFSYQLYKFHKMIDEAWLK